MLIHCPRCGFQQPQDKYCAQCGVDMETYKPATPPVWKRFFGNLTVQLTLLVIIAGGVGGILYQKGQKSLERRVGQYRSTVQISRSSNSPSEIAGSDSTSSKTEGSSAAATMEAASEKNKAADANKEVAFSEGTSSTAAPSADKPVDKAKSEARAPANISEPHIEVFYAEVSRRTLNNIFATSRNTGQFMNFNDYTAGILPNIDKAIADSTIKILTKEIRSIDSPQNLKWFYGIKSPHDPEIEIGLTTLFDISEVENGNLRGNFEIRRSWREAVASGGYEIQSKSFPAMLEIGGGTGFFMAGVMPLQSNLENDDELTAIEVYKILRSTSFRSGDNEFVIFIKFEKGN